MQSKVSLPVDEGELTLGIWQMMEPERYVRVFLRYPLATMNHLVELAEGSPEFVDIEGNQDFKIRVEPVK